MGQNEFVKMNWKNKGSTRKTTIHEKREVQEVKSTQTRLFFEAMHRLSCRGQWPVKAATSLAGKTQVSNLRGKQLKSKGQSTHHKGTKQKEAQSSAF